MHISVDVDRWWQRIRMVDEIMVAVKLNAQAQPKRFADVLKLVAKGREEINSQVYSAARSIVSPKYKRD